MPEDARLADGTRGAAGGLALGGLYRRSMQRALDEVHGPGRGVVFGRSGWSGQQATGVAVGRRPGERLLVAAGARRRGAVAGASGFSNWSHDVGGYLGARGVDRCPPELLLRWAQVGCFTPLMQAHGRLVQEPGRTTRGRSPSTAATCCCTRCSCRTSARRPRPRPAAGRRCGGRTRSSTQRDDAGWAVADAFGFGPSLWVAPVLEDGARGASVRLPRGDWIETWSGARVAGGAGRRRPRRCTRCRSGCGAGALVVTYPAEHVARGLGDTPEAERPLVATLWGEPRCGRALARLADGTRIAWRRGRWSVPAGPRRRVRGHRGRRAVTT